MSSVRPRLTLRLDGSWVSYSSPAPEKPRLPGLLGKQRSALLGPGVLGPRGEVQACTCDKTPGCSEDNRQLPGARGAGRRRGIYSEERWLVIPERTWRKETEITGLPPNFVNFIDLRRESLQTTDALSDGAGRCELGCTCHGL